MTVLTKATSWHFEILNLKFLKRLKFSLTWETMVVKISNSTPPTDIVLYQLNLFCIFLVSVLTKVTYKIGIVKFQI